MKSRAAIVFALVSMSFALSGCCKGCSAVKGFAKDIVGPNETEGVRLVEEKLKSDKGLLEKLCGVKTEGLKDVSVKSQTSSSFQIEGKPKEGNAAKALVCTGVIMAFWHAEETPSGTVWSIESIKVKQVTTPGAEYTAPSSDFDD